MYSMYYNWILFKKKNCSTFNVYFVHFAIAQGFVSTST